MAVYDDEPFDDDVTVTLRDDMTAAEVAEQLWRLFGAERCATIVFALSAKVQGKRVRDGN